MAAFEEGVNYPVIPEMNAYWGPMETAMRSVFDEGVDPRTALQNAYESIINAVAEMRDQ